MANAHRGHAILEFALVAPLLVLLLLYSVYFTELVQAKLKLLEAARYAAWEVTSFSLSDFGSNQHEEVFRQAAGTVARATEERYRYLDGADSRSRYGLAISPRDLQAVVTQGPVVSTRRIDELSAAGMRSGTPEGSGWTSSIFGAARGTLGAVLERWGFNTQGQIRVRVSAAV